ncbi:hypothetical protein BJX66DRAFT_160484 [Aspergillus keveii]|uniref:Secreted protein n=1 Tax=Aspergillus keveii TaxID=714993 RepID=A0ABR4GA17_9EURO
MLPCPFLVPGFVLVSRYAYKYCTQNARMVVHQKGHQPNNSNKAKHISTKPNISRSNKKKQNQEQQTTQIRLGHPNVGKEPTHCPGKAGK